MSPVNELTCFHCEQSFAVNKAGCCVNLWDLIYHTSRQQQQQQQWYIWQVSVLFETASNRFIKLIDATIDYLL